METCSQRASLSILLPALSVFVYLRTSRSLGQSVRFFYVVEYKILAVSGYLHWFGDAISYYVCRRLYYMAMLDTK